MVGRLTLSVLCGGQSTEHEVSIRSAKYVVSCLNDDQYDVSVIFIDHAGKWHLIGNKKDFLDSEPQMLVDAQKALPMTVLLGGEKEPWLFLNDSNCRHRVDCVFPVLHGTNGEDGALQGMLDLLNLPYVGADAQSSAICMEKDITKCLLRAGHIPVLDWCTIHPHDNLPGLYETLKRQFGPEMFVKATSLGSSVGTVPVKDEAEFLRAVKEVFRFDERVIVEPRVRGREIECAVLGNSDPRASLPGEIISHHDYYSYAAKYLDPNGATTEVPAKLTPAIVKKIQDIAVSAFRALNCSGMARVDFFLVNEKEIYVNELNTIPGFTSISLYPKMWEASGLSGPELMNRLIALALERYRHQQTLIRRYTPEG